jgi:hypothetical protein
LVLRLGSFRVFRVAGGGRAARLERVGVLVLLISALFHSLTSPRHATASEIGIPQPLTRERLCSFILPSCRLGDRGVCYTSSNHLAYYALRYVCGYRELADSVYRFLESYPADFYDYHRVLVGSRYPSPS